jgi:hypothetical protein
LFFRCGFLFLAARRSEKYSSVRVKATTRTDEFRFIIHPPIKNAPPVGASLLAKIVNDDVYQQDKRRASKTFASKLAPTGSRTPWTNPDPALKVQNLEYSAAQSHPHE